MMTYNDAIKTIDSGDLLEAIHGRLNVREIAIYELCSRGINKSGERCGLADALDSFGMTPYHVKSITGGTLSRHADIREARAARDAAGLGAWVANARKFNAMAITRDGRTCYGNL